MVEVRLQGLEHLVRHQFRLLRLRGVLLRLFKRLQLPKDFQRIALCRPVDVHRDLFDVFVDLRLQAGEIPFDGLSICVEPLEVPPLRRRAGSARLLDLARGRALERELVLERAEKHGALRDELVLKLFEENVLNQVLSEVVERAVLVCEDRDFFVCLGYRAKRVELRVLFRLLFFLLLRALF